MFKEIKEWLFPDNKGFDPHVSFFGLKVVRLTVALWGMVFIVASIVCIATLPEEYVLDISFNGFNTFAFEILKVPVTFLAILIPIGAVYAANHRSQQSIEAARLTRVQNHFSNYYKHIEEFEKYADKYNPLKWFGLSKKVTSIYSRQLHTILYGKRQSSPDYRADASVLHWEPDYRADASVLRCAYEILNEMSGSVEDYFISMCRPKNDSPPLLSTGRSFESQITTKYKKMTNNISHSVDFKKGPLIRGNENEFRYRELLHHEDFSRAYSQYSECLVIFHLLVYLFKFDDNEDADLIRKSDTLIAQIRVKLGTQYQPQNH